MRLPGRTLLLVHRTMLEAYRCTTADELRRLIPLKLEVLIGSDRASVNDIHVSPDKQVVIPHPVPHWWPRFGETYQRHMLDHPLWSEQSAELVRINDRGPTRAWLRSTLYNEYFVPLGIRHQMSVAISRGGTKMVGVAVNRDKRSFSDVDGAILQLLAPHLTQALHFVTRLEALTNVASALASGEGASNAEPLVVDRQLATIEYASHRCSCWLAEIIGAPCRVGDDLPLLLRDWLRAKLEQRRDPSGLLAPSAALHLASARRRLWVRLAAAPSERFVLLIEEQPERAPAQLPVSLTVRERQVLHWIREGKRNREIGTILGISSRTVGKHVEHVLEKLGVETRTAAVLVAAEGLQAL